MQQNIKGCSFQYLRSIFSILDTLEDYVFWIRNHDMSQQFYMNASYENIWQREPSILYDLPLMWLDYLPKDDNHASMMRFQERHIQNYENPHKNLLLYQIQQPNQTLVYLRDHCFRCKNKKGEIFIIGITKLIPEVHWHEQLQYDVIDVDAKDERVYKLFFDLLGKHFGIAKLVQVVTNPTSLEMLRLHLKQSQHIGLSKRELECLYHLCHGKTAKQTAREMLISHRTVETHLDNLRNKVTVSSKLELAGKFAHYFSITTDDLSP